MQQPRLRTTKQCNSGKYTSITVQYDCHKLGEEICSTVQNSITGVPNNPTKIYLENDEIICEEIVIRDIIIARRDSCSFIWTLERLAHFDCCTERPTMTWIKMKNFLRKLQICFSYELLSIYISLIIYADWYSPASYTIITIHNYINIYTINTGCTFWWNYAVK